MDQSDTYHLRRMEREMPDRADQLAVLRGQKFLTLAMAKDNQPYLVSLNYAFSEQENCFYVHCAGEGKKLDYLSANPCVWGQVIEDRGYCVGKCAHSYRSVMFQGQAELVADEQQKRQALSLMIDHVEVDPEPLKQKLLDQASVQKVTIVRLRVRAMTGKCGS